MLLFLLAYLGGVLTILSPCILPVLPFVFARADQSFVRARLPLLAGMALTFAAFATLAAVGGGWVVKANEYGRWAAVALIVIFGLALIFPALSDMLSRPFVAMGNRMAGNSGARANATPISSFILGSATGLLWAPCAGPILGLVLTGAALQGASVGTTLLLLAYAAGAATSLGLALFAGAKVFAAMKRGLGAGEWIRRGLGIAMLGGAAAIVSGLDTGVLARLSVASTTRLEDALIAKLTPGKVRTDMANGSGMSGSMRGAAEAAAGSVPALPVEGVLPALSGAVQWLNSPPLSAQDLRGKVVLIDFWTYSCINCLRALPYVRAWAEKYRDQGLVVVGVHAPEFAFEKNVDNVKRAVADLGIDYPVAIDNDYAIWKAFDNQYWPAHYFVDAQGRIRFHHFGEGQYDQSERVIQQLLAEAGHRNVPGPLVKVDAQGVQMAPDMSAIGSPETYIGYGRAEHFASQGGQRRDTAHGYVPNTALELNQWALAGEWTVAQENARLERPGGKLLFRFHARDLHLVLGPDQAGHPIRFRIRVDGAPPGRDHGADVSEDGAGEVSSQRLYQLVRQSGPVRDRTFEIEFLDPGVQAYAFTFG
ncbi:cytochrome c biogenesis protein DipZ [Pollutimonas bauzanensis]|uniref:Cytochrome c biogenesis protein CcdA n=1 Tax=Pollutimonas bauzanensis TaxID=658167 RepID=A0A1M5W4E3_9BURK|nr:cytochrome c biogenesis protein DipZ [Pollutimonas bauzanensis]SHH82073.1 Cytochrome c biogenesis protein CcdA [Pollutimonas bauzanensis]